MKLHWGRSGRGPELVLLHGWGLHGGAWGGWPERLARRFAVNIVDLPGHGRSTFSGPFTLESVADEIAATLAAPAIWIGWSLGGMAALAAAMRHPERVRALALVATTPRFVRTAGWDAATGAGQLERFARDLRRDYQGTLENFLSLQIGAAAGARELIRSLRARLEELPAPHPGALDAGLEVLRSADLRTGLADVRAPAAVIHGGRDRLIPPPAAEYLARALPAARLTLIEAAGHAPFLSHLPEVEAAFEELLGESG